MKDKITLANMDPAVVCREIEDFLINQIVSIGYRGGVVGLSGGVDSTTVAAIAKGGFDRYNGLSLEERIRFYQSIHPEEDLTLNGYMLPSNTNNPADTADGKKVAERLGIYKPENIISIEPVVQAYSLTNSETLASKFHKGNLMSEIRATILHAKAAINGALVLGTGNKDEDFGVGYYTMFGDGAVHCSPIGNLPKRLVKQMAAYKGFSDLANRIPTAGLEPGQTDFKDLGYSYDTVEIVSRGLELGLNKEQIVQDRLIVESTAKDIQQYQRLYGKSKFADTKEIVKDIIRRNRIAEAKSSMISPPIAPVTLHYS